MARGRPRRVPPDAVHVVPLPAERLDGPRFDGSYRSTDVVLRFSSAGRVEVSGVTGRWTAHAGTIRVVAAGLDVEAVVGLDALFVERGLAPENGFAEAILDFRPDALA